MKRSVRRGGQRLERARQRVAGEVALEQLDSERLIAVGVDEHDRAGVRALIEREPGVGAERNQKLLIRHVNSGGSPTLAPEERRKVGHGVSVFSCRVDTGAVRFAVSDCCYVAAALGLKIARTTREIPKLTRMALIMSSLL